MSDYTQQKLWEAVNALIGTGTVQQRLNYAGQYLVVLRVHETAFPPASPELQGRVKRLLERLTEAGSIEATAQRLSDSDAEDLASEILSLFCESNSWGGQKPRLRASDTLILPRDFH